MTFRLLPWRLARRLVLALLLASTTAADARTTMTNELKDSFIPIVQYVRQFYLYEVSPDTLMQAGMRGVFQALDPASDYTITSDPDSDCAAGDDDCQWRANFGFFERAVRNVDDRAFYAVGPDTLIRFGIAGMMSVLDPDTVFMEKLNLANFHINTRGEYGGLGFRIQVVRPDSAIAVWSLLHDQTPAALAGVKSGDLIIAIDDSSTGAMNASDAASLMRGPAGTDVTLTLRRAGVDEPFDVTVTRQVVHINSVPYHVMFPDSTGYIKLSGFQHKSSGEVRQALAELLEAGMQRLIFDLRGNGGGYLTEAVQIADLFLPANRLVVYTAGRAFSDTTEYITREPAMFGEGPLVILVDGHSASASEIVSGAIQDWDRGLVLGQPTVGKGSVQQTVNIGDRAELKLTMAAYFIPSGRSIDKRMRKDSTLVAMAEQDYRTRVLGRLVRGAGGITPDIESDGRQSTSLYRQLEGWRTRNSRFFRFARQYQVQHPDVTPDFIADERTLADFRAFAETDSFDYVSDLEIRLEQVRDELADEEEGDAHDEFAEHLDRSDELVDAIEEHHWADDAALISWKLTFDIREKAFGMPAAYAYDVTVDPQVLHAREVLHDEDTYVSWFQRPVIGDDEDIVAAAGDTAAVETTGMAGIAGPEDAPGQD